MAIRGKKMEAGEKKLTDVTTNYFNEKMIKKIHRKDGVLDKGGGGVP